MSLLVHFRVLLVGRICKTSQESILEPCSPLLLQVGVSSACSLCLRGKEGPLQSRGRGRAEMLPCLCTRESHNSKICDCDSGAWGRVGARAGQWGTPASLVFPRRVSCLLFLPSAHLVLCQCLLELFASKPLSPEPPLSVWILVKADFLVAPNNPKQSWACSVLSCKDPIHSVSLAARSSLPVQPSAMAPSPMPGDSLR